MSEHDDYCPDYSSNHQDNQCNHHHGSSSDDYYLLLELHQVKQDKGAKTFIYRDVNEKKKGFWSKVMDFLLMKLP